MQQPATQNPDRFLRLAVLGVLAVTALRVLALAFSRTELFVDESQYWLWGQTLDFGYYSKPPMVAWVIRAFTELGGSNASFWVRLAGPLFHAATAFILMAAAGRLFGRGAAAVTALAYVTLPLASLGSIVISTDTVLFPFFALALLFYLRLLDRPSATDALLAGLCLGLAFLSKYAAIYLLISAVLAAALRRDARPALRDTGLALLVFVLVILPNILWNMSHGGSTVEHTLDNASWVRDPSAKVSLNLDGLAEFLGAQFLFFGPVLFAALIWSVWRALTGRAGRHEALLLVFCLPILLIVSAQAVIYRAYGNWAATAYIAATLVVVPLLWQRAPRWLAASFVINAVLAVALPLVTIFADRLTWDGELVAERVLGRERLSQRIIDAARDTGAATVVSVNRDVLADLFYTGRDSGLAFRAVRGDGPPQHHYEMSFAYDGTAEGKVLLVAEGPGPDCPANVVDSWTAGPGAYAGRVFTIYAVGPDCTALGR